jgi:DNA-binding XRE family transcriptional regulator
LLTFSHPDDASVPDLQCQHVSGNLPECSHLSGKGAAHRQRVESGEHTAVAGSAAVKPVEAGAQIVLPWLFLERVYHVSILAYLVNPFFRYCFKVLTDKLSDAISSHVASILKEEREKRDLSLKKLAEKSGISRQAISYVEQEVQSPSLDTMLRIALAMNADLSKIISRAQKRASKSLAVVPTVKK